MNIPVSYQWRTPNNNNFISGYGYHCMCNWSVCPRYTQKFDSKSISENDFVFLNLDYFEHFVNYLRSNRPVNKFILVTQNSDRDFTSDMFPYIKEFVTKIFAINCTFSDEMVVKIPLGFNDHSTEVLDKMDFSFTPKSNLIYMNFKLHHHPERPGCYNHFKQFDWVCVEKNFLPLQDFYSKLKTYKYCICPRGTGIDTHRIYESLYFGVIPIVKRNELSDLYEKLPLVLIEDWSEITEYFLESNYDVFKKKFIDWVSENPNWYKTEFWLK